MKNGKIPEISIYSKASPDRMLRDHRSPNLSRKFGFLKDVARHYGISCIPLENCIEYRAPRSRLLLFMEKLHFSMTPYSKKPY